MKRSVARLALPLLILALAVPATANSAQLYWDGAPGFSVCSVDSATPITVESEALTFDLRNAAWHGTGRVTASYEMKNPTGGKVVSDMIFPVIDSFKEFQPSEVSVSAGGADAPYELYIGDVTDSAEGFSLSDSVAALGASEYTPRHFNAAGGTLYSFKVTTARESLVLVFDFTPSSSVRVIGHGFNSYSTNDDGSVTVSAHYDADDGATLYAVGGTLDLSVSAHTGGSERTPVTDYSCEIVTEAVAPEDFFADNIGRSDSVSPYNAISLKNYYYRLLDRIFEHNVFAADYDISDYERRVLFIRYSVEFAAGESKNVTVSYNAAAAADATQTLDYQYSYDYLLSPAKNWADFGAIAVTVYTSEQSPYIAKNNIGLTRSESGVYTVSLDSLPEGELSFTTYTKPEITEADIKKATAKRRMDNVRFFFIYFWWLLIPAAVIAAVIIVLVIKRKAKNNDRKN